MFRDSMSLRESFANDVKLLASNSELTKLPPLGSHFATRKILGAVKIPP